MSEEAQLSGTWVALEVVSPENQGEVSTLDVIRQRTPNLGGAAGRRSELKSFAPAMVIRSRASGEALGLIENGEMIGYPGVAVVLIFVDQDRARPGFALEAFALYLAHVFASGARLVHVEVLAFNEAVLRMLRRIGVSEQARLRDQIYSGGRYWDVVVFAFDAIQFNSVLDRYRRALPGGDRKPAAFGSRRRV
jgi:hypothetical protein